MPLIRAVFWDSDNTLVDTRDLHWRKHCSILSQHGISLKNSDQDRIYHNNGQQNWQWLSSERGLNLDCATYLDQIDSWYMAHLNEAQLREGVSESLEFLNEQAIPQIVVSNGRRRSVVSALDAKNISHYFKAILCKEDYEGRKPDPAPYLTALSVMQDFTNVTADQSLAIEDDPLGVTSAKTAGMHVIHRRLNESDKAAKDCDISVYAACDFVSAVKGFLTP